MKTTSYIIKTAFALTALVAAAACSDEPAVGTPLNPVEPEDMSPKVYIMETANGINKSQYRVIETPGDFIIPEDTVYIYARINHAVDHDVVVDAEENNSEAVKAISGSVALGDGALAFPVKSVTIKAGEKQSAMPIKVVLAKSEALKNLDGVGACGVSLTTNTDGVKVGSNYNLYSIKVNKLVTNIKESDLTEFSEYTQIPFDAYTLKFNDEVTTKFNDDNLKTYVYDSGDVTIDVAFTSERTLKGFWYKAGAYYPYQMNQFEVMTSSDGENWTSQSKGGFTVSRIFRSLDNEIPFTFYTPAKCKYLRIVCHQSYYGSQSSSDNFTVISEFRMFE